MLSQTNQPRGWEMMMVPAPLAWLVYSGHRKAVSLWVEKAETAQPHLHF